MQCSVEIRPNVTDARSWVSKMHPSVSLGESPTEVAGRFADRLRAIICLTLQAIPGRDPAEGGARQIAIDTRPPE
jgi:hypothetical protein